MVTGRKTKTGYWRRNPATGEMDWIEGSYQPPKPETIKQSKLVPIPVTGEPGEFVDLPEFIPSPEKVTPQQFEGQIKQLESSLRLAYPEMFDPARSYGVSEERMPFMVSEQLGLRMEEDYEGFLQDLTARVGEFEAEKILRQFGVPQDAILAGQSFIEQEEKTTRAIQSLFPDFGTIPEFIELLDKDAQLVLDTLRVEGRTPEAEYLLGLFEFTEQDIDKFFGEPVLTDEFLTGTAPGAVLQLEPEWENVRTGEVITASEKASRYPKGYESELDDWRLTTKTVRNYGSVFKVFAESLTKVPRQLGAAILQAVQGQAGASVVDKDWADEWIAGAAADQRAFVEKVAQEYKQTRLPVNVVDVAELPQNIAFSLTSMGAGLAIGLPVALTPVPGARVAAWGLGTAASGAVAYNMTTYQIMQQYLEVKNHEMMAKVGRELTAEEEEALKKDFSGQATKYGLWEAIPEAISNLAFAKILTMPLGKMVGRNIANKIIGKLVGLYGEEFLTETITQKGQSDIEVEAGLREGNITWVEAFKEIAPQTFLLTTILGGAGQIGVSSVNRIKQSLKKEIGESPVYDAIKENITPEIFAEVEAEAVVPPAKPVTPTAPVTPEVTLYRGEPVGVRPVSEGLVPFTPDLAVAQGWAGKEGRVVQVTMTREEFDKLQFQKLPDQTATYRVPQDIYGKAVEVPKVEQIVGMPEAGLQPEMFGAPPTEVRPPGKGRVTQISMEDQLKLEQARRAAVEAPTEVKEAYEAQAEIEGLKEWLTTEPAAKLTNLIKKTGWYKGEVKNLTLKQYRDITGKTEIKPNLLTSDKKHVKWEYALDDIATEMGYESGEVLKGAIEQTGEANVRIKELETKIKKQMTERPLSAVPEMKTREIARREEIIGYVGGYDITQAQAEVLAGVFAEYIMSDNIVTAYELQRELFKKTRAARAEQFKARMQELIVSEGMPVEGAFKQATQETLAGKLPIISTDFLDNMTNDMREALYLLVFNNAKMQQYPLEMANTLTALTNALTGQAIPRKKGTGSVLFPEGGSAWDRLNMVFGKQPQIVKALDKIAEQGKSLKDVVEGVFREPGQEPIPIDQATLDYHRSLINIPYGYKTMFEPEFKSPRVTDLRTPADLQFAKAELELGEKFAKGELTFEEFQLARMEARDRAYPLPPVARFEAPIEKAFKQGEMWTSGEKQMLIRVLKEIAWSPVDIFNFLRANKASFDQSFLRQAKVFASGHPLVGFEAHTTAWQSTFSQKHTEADWQQITRDPDFELYEHLRLERDADPLRIPAFAMEKGTAQWRTAEEFGFPTVERLIPRLTMKLPHIKYSERGFTAGTNKVVWRLWKMKLKSERRYAEKVASGQVILKPGESVDIVKEMGDFQQLLANGIQRANLGKLKEAAPFFSAIFFAARSKLGRFFFPSHLLGIVFRKGKLGFSPGVMKEAWRDFAAMTALFGGLMLLGDWLRLWDTEKDPRNAEYMSARIGNMRIDPWAGYRQFVVLYARLATGTGISSVTGAEYEVNKLGALQNFFRTSLSPGASILLDFWTGRNFLGQIVEVTNARQWLDRVMPFLIVDVWEAFEEGTKEGAISIVPSIYGEGVQTYTGDWKENYTKLGLPKYFENFAYGLTEPRYDLADFWSDTVSQFKDVDPATLTEQKGYPAYIRDMVETKRIQEQLETIPSEKLVSLNADPTKDEATFVQYYQRWRQREGLVNVGDEAVFEDKELQPDGKYKTVTYKGDDAVTAFDKKYPRTYLGNFSQRQFALLNEYWSITDKKKQAEFLEKHKAEIGTNLRDAWLRSRPTENARLALYGRAKILTKEAYTQYNQMLNKFDYPESAIPEMTLPPEGSIDTHFKYEEMVSEGTHGSWEAQLLIKQDAQKAKDAKVQSYADWHELKLSDSPLASLELKVNNRANFDKLEAFSDRGSPDYIADDKARAEAIKEFKLANPDFVDDMRRIEAIEKGTEDAPVDDALIGAHVDYGRLIDEPGRGSSSAEAMLFRVDNSEYDTFRADANIWGDQALKPIDQSRIPIWRIDVQYREQDTEYQAILDKYPERPPEEIAEAKAYLDANPEYRMDRRRREAYGLSNSATGEKFPVTEVENYVAYNELSIKGKRRDRFLIENGGQDPDNLTGFALAMHTIEGRDIPRLEDVPSIEYDNIYDEWRDEFEKIEGLANNKSEFYIEDPIARQTEYDRMRYTTGRQTYSGVSINNKIVTGFRLAELKREAYGNFVPENHVNEYVQWRKVQDEGKPSDWNGMTRQDRWYEDDWFMMEHRDFYKNVYLNPKYNNGVRRDKLDFRKVPTKPVFWKWLRYNSIQNNQAARDEYRLYNLDLDQWGVLAGIWSKTMSEQRRRMGQTPQERFEEEFAERQKEMEKRLEELGKGVW